MTDEDRGHDFHEQLFALLPQAAHTDDADHHRAVGAAIRIALDEGDPRRAEHAYNVWATTHGYQPVTLIEAGPDGSVRADIHEAVIALDRAGRVSVLKARI